MRLIKVVDATKVYNGIALYMAENAYLNDTALDVLKMVANWLNEAPTVDAVEVVHGWWVEKKLDDFRMWELKCSKCGWIGISNYDAYDEPYDFNYCPCCGAKMDGDGNG